MAENTLVSSASRSRLSSDPPSPRLSRHHRPHRQTSFPAADGVPDEQTGLLQGQRLRPSRQPHLARSHSYAGVQSRHHYRTESLGQRLVNALSDRQDPMSESKASIASDERLWYDQFTSTDWVHDSILDSYRVKALRSRKDFWGRVYVLFDGAQGWILSALVGFVVAVLAYAIDVSEALIFDFKDGYCALGWYMTEKVNRYTASPEVFGVQGPAQVWAEYGTYVCGVIVLAFAACLVTLESRTVVPSSFQLATLDENLAAQPVSASSVDDQAGSGDDGASGISQQRQSGGNEIPTNGSGALNSSSGTPPPLDDKTGPPSTSRVYYSAAGSGVAEVRVILSGFVLHGFLGLRTLVIKTVGLVLSVASGLSLGKEGPYVHIATCVGNIACRLFNKYDQNDAKRREVLSAAAAAGVAVAFGAPLGGVLFCLEEVAYFFPAKTLFRTFFCCITAALTLKFLDPYGTNKIVMFQVQYPVDWEYFELGSFVAVGVLGGVAGAVFIKASRHWARSFRGIPMIRSHPLLEVVLVALATGLVGYWNNLTKLPVAELLYNLAAPCDHTDNNLANLGICPSEVDEIPPILLKLLGAFLIKGVLTIITFGIKVPAGIYVPSMVVGGLMGRLVGHIVQWVVLSTPDWSVWGTCPAVGEATCIQPGVYGLIAAGATMCGVTRLSVTLAVILFEITGSLDYVLPFSLAILVAKWTADAIEPLSIYDLLTEMNSYPFLNNKHKPIFTSDLADILPRARSHRIIDISSSPLVKASVLRQKLESLHRAGELDGGLPIVRNEILVGLIPAPDLEFALDNLRDEASSLCLMASVPSIDDSDDEARGVDPTDFTRYIDPAPVALDIRSPMDLVHECFVKLGLRYICVLRDGRYAGMAHKKTFVKYVRDLESRDGHM
ncbi:hypothetical protein SEPCBS119000_000071 [Sporothrix epigloea]|uniref:Chloride channel protein n=1 Tax=Sporothrix epigloea TaxID=1892477 RepID=A0ABP0D4R2_9PEZI